MRTPAREVTGSEVRVRPSDEPGIRFDGVEATLENVSKADVRVDVGEGRERSFVVEHVLGVLGMFGVTAADVAGLGEEWDFARPEHRFCYSVGSGPDRVVGHPAGLPNPGLAAALAEAGVEGSVETRTTVARKVTHEFGGGRIVIRPREYGAGVRFEARYEGATYAADVDPKGGTDSDVVDAVTHSQTPFLSSSPEEAVTHAIADLVSDVAVLGGLDDAHVEADLGEAYHGLTIDSVRTAHEEGAVVQREE